MKTTPNQPEVNDWEDRLKILVNEWVKRLIKFGDLNEPKRYGGWTVYECPDLTPFIRSLLQKERQGIREEVERMGSDIVIPGLLETYIIKNKVLQLLEDKDV